jgi:hypothetical protein
MAPYIPLRQPMEAVGVLVKETLTISHTIDILVLEKPAKDKQEQHTARLSDWVNSRHKDQMAYLEMQSKPALFYGESYKKHKPILPYYQTGSWVSALGGLKDTAKIYDEQMPKGILGLCYKINGEKKISGRQQEKNNSYESSLTAVHEKLHSVLDQEGIVNGEYLIHSRAIDANEGWKQTKEPVYRRSSTANIPALHYSAINSGKYSNRC